MQILQTNTASKHTGFTLVELLVTIAIIGVLTSVVLGSFHDAHVRARDALREEHMHSIANALEMYYLEYGCVPTTSATTCGPAAGTYSQRDAGGWDYSSQGGEFMGFLKTAGFISQVPVDPVNNMTSDMNPIYTYAFRYYCYPSAEDQGVHLSYINETTGEEIPVIPQTLGVMATQSWTDPTFKCK
jgi:prepilin-type N-terminal cleavage/methylation domain-containing protein